MLKGNNVDSPKLKARLLLQYILNIYCTMMTRGILGTYIYVCDENLKKYLKKYF